MDDFYGICQIVKNVSRETFLTLKVYEAHLLTWNRQTNLVARGEESHVWPRHFLDSAQLYPYLVGENDVPILDLGSGAGFPGLVLSILLNREIILVESDLKKAVFLRETIRLTKSKATVFHGRIESLTIDRGSVIVSRALASLDDLVSFGLFLGSKKGYFLKGRRTANEIDHLTYPVSSLISHPSCLNEDTKIVEVVF